MCVSMYEYMHMSAGAPGVQKQVSGLLELDL